MHVDIIKPGIAARLILSTCPSESGHCMHVSEFRELNPFRNETNSYPEMDCRRCDLHCPFQKPSAQDSKSQNCKHTVKIENNG